MNDYFLNLVKETSERNWSADRCDPIPLCRWQGAWDFYIEILKIVPENKIRISPCSDGLIHFNIVVNHLRFVIEYDINTVFIQFDYSVEERVFIESEIPLGLALKLLNSWWAVYK